MSFYKHDKPLGEQSNDLRFGSNIRWLNPPPPPPNKGLKKSSFTKASLTERQIGTTMGRDVGGKRKGVGAEGFSIRKTQHEKVDGPPSGKKGKKRRDHT